MAEFLNDKELLNIDVTHDDPVVTDMTNTYSNAIRYDYYLISEEYIVNNSEGLRVIHGNNHPEATINYKHGYESVYY